jgi:hypothetical protein
MNNEPAFPRDHRHDGHNGMALRDYFAAKAMQEFCTEMDDDDHMAEIAYKIADAMMKARTK